MFRNYLIVALRNLRKHKTYSAINIAGLAIGMACCAIILLYVQHELNYDAFHSKGDRIYRVLQEVRDADGQVRFYASISGAFGKAVQDAFPEVEEVVRISLNGVHTATIGEKRVQLREGADDKHFFSESLCPYSVPSNRATWFRVGQNPHLLSRLKKLEIQYSYVSTFATALRYRHLHWNKAHRAYQIEPRSSLAP